MRRAVRVAGAAAALSLLWLAALLHARVLPGWDFPAWADDIVPVIPLWALVTFGSYALGSIGWSLLTFGDCPDAYISLLKDISDAKDDLRRRGVTV
ncbi:dolichol-phosphate mannosyltransferase subunit 3, partial [Zopfochytrium polystomum]